MIGILTLEIISVLSLAFAVLNTIFTFTSLSQMFVLFLYSVVTTIILVYLQKKNKWYRALTILLLLPLLYFKDKSAFWFLLYLTTFTFVYIIKSLGKGNYEHFSRRLKTSFVIIAAITVFAVLFDFFRDSIMPGVAFVVIYLLSTIILVRSLRHIESGMDMDKLKKINLRYLIIIGVLSIALTIDSIRNVVGFILSNIYGIVVDGAMAILLIPIRIFSLLIEKLIEWISKGEEGEFGIEAPEMKFVENGANYTSLIKSDVFKETLFNILSLAAFILIVYILYKILSKVGNRNHEGLKYREEREYIKADTRKKRRFFERYPKAFKEQVRYYYRKYLRALEKKKVDINNSDTSLDIKKSSKDVFKNTDEIREIYIKARYGDEDIEAKDVEKIRRLYKDN